MFKCRRTCRAFKSSKLALTQYVLVVLVVSSDGDGDDDADDLVFIIIIAM